MRAKAIDPSSRVMSFANLKLMDFAVARAPEVVMAVDWTNGGSRLLITYVNAAFTRRCTWEEAIDQSPTMLCGPSTDRDVLKQGLQNVLRDGRGVRRDSLSQKRHADLA
jgi:hypothetical protein